MTNPNSLYMPYGAYELKARYQLNLMLAMLITTTFVALILTGAWVASQTKDEVPVPVAPPPDVISIIDWPTESIVISRPVIPAEPKASSRPEVGIPEPRPDDEVLDEHVVIATRQEMAEYIDSERSGIIDGAGIIVEVVDTTPYLPERGEFVSVEIYPVFVYHHVPKYPRLQKDAGITGVVVLEVLVGTDGNVIDAKIARTSHSTALDEAALEAAYKNVFSPGIQNGRPVACWVSYSVNFELD